jgi:competence protein ComEC
MSKKTKLLIFSLISLIIFLAIRVNSFYVSGKQNKLVIYNVPKHTAIDIIAGRRTSFYSDIDLNTNNFLLSFHILPSRIISRSTNATNADLPYSFEYAGKRIMRIDTSLKLKTTDQKQAIDLMILSKNSRLYIKDLNNVFIIHKLVIDSSVPAWQARLWKKDCDSLKITCFDVAEKGAFEMTF